MRSKTLGSTLIVAGTCIGAGMLALPLVAAAIGFWAGILLMLLVWGLAAYSGLLTAEACRSCPNAKNLHGIAGEILGKGGQLVAVGAMLFLFYALCAAYITGGAGQLVAILGQYGLAIEQWQGAVLVTLIVGVVTVIGTAMVDYINRVLFLVMLTMLVLVLALLLPDIKSEYLIAKEASSGLLLAALPVLYTSFGYQGSVPSVVDYVDGKPGKFRKAVLIGSSLPLVIYFLWQLAANGVLSPQDVSSVATSSDSVGVLMSSLGSAVGSGSITSAVNVFAALALATSFLGVALGLFDYLADASGRKGNTAGRIQTIFLTLTPPLAASLFAPDSFITALGYAAVALVILAVYLPVAMVWRLRSQNSSTDYRVAGGRPAMAIAALLGSIIIGSQFGIVTGILPVIG